MKPENSYQPIGLKNGIVGSGNGLSPVWRQAIAWTNAALSSIGLFGTSIISIQGNAFDGHFILAAMC